MSIRQLGRVIAAVFAIFVAAAATGAAAQTYTIGRAFTGGGGETGMATIVMTNASLADGAYGGAATVAPELVSITLTLNNLGAAPTTTTFTAGQLSGFYFVRGGGVITDVNYWAAVANPDGYTLTGTAANQTTLTKGGYSVSLASVAAAVATVPTLSEWAMILFALLLAGGAAIYVQRRRLTA